MSASVVAFRRPVRRPQDWSAQELAEFYRVEAALIRVGLKVEIDRGLTDEGDPWFVFCRADDGEVVIHFARIDDMYVVGSSAYNGVAQGRDFNALVRSLIERHPIVKPCNENKSNIIFHPAALLVMLVATAIFKTSAAHAFTLGHDTGPDSSARHATQSGIIATTPFPVTDSVVVIDAQCAGVILSAVVIALAADLTAASSVTTQHSPSVPDADVFSRPWTHDHLVDLSARSNVLDLQLPVYDFGLSSPSAIRGTEALSLMGILWALPGSKSQLLDPEGVQYGLGDSAGSNHTPSLLSSLASDIAPVLDSSLVSGSGQIPGSLVIELQGGVNTLPNVIAAHIVFESGVMVALPQNALVYLPSLPTVLTSVLNSSLHIPGDTATLLLADQSDYVASPSTQDIFNGGATESQNHLHALTTTVTSSSAPPTSSSFVQTNTPELHQGPVVSDLTIGQLPTDAQMLSAVETSVKEFTAEASQVKFIITANSIVIYDATAVDQHVANVTSVTFDFKDGSSISLVGLPGEIAHALGH